MVWVKETPAYDTGNATADDSGYFFFFNPNNVEVVVKVLNACHTRFHSFWVEAEWKRPDGLTSVATAEALTGDTGVFSFFHPDNLEIVVKVLSNCSGPTRRFWVFAGGLTNLEVTLRVTDTDTGDVKTYLNPQRQPFQPIQDTRAFETCDG